PINKPQFSFGSQGIPHMLSPIFIVFSLQLNSSDQITRSIRRMEIQWRSHSFLRHREPAPTAFRSLRRRQLSAVDF
ncbi:unnamed protein product, partial [Arabidopsis halleri]